VQCEFKFESRGEEKVMRGKVARIGLASLVVAFVAMLVVAGRVGGAAAQEKAASTADVKIDNFSFWPTALTVPVGTTVTWTECSSPRRWTRTTNFRSCSASRVLIRISVRFTRK
jgi:plastocyanin